MSHIDDQYDPMTGIDPANVISGKRRRKETKFFEQEYDYNAYTGTCSQWVIDLKGQNPHKTDWSDHPRYNEMTDDEKDLMMFDARDDEDECDESLNTCDDDDDDDEYDDEDDEEYDDEDRKFIVSSDSDEDQSDEYDDEDDDNDDDDDDDEELDFMSPRKRPVSPRSPKKRNMSPRSEKKRNTSPRSPKKRRI